MNNKLTSIIRKELIKLFESGAHLKTEGTLSFDDPFAGTGGAPDFGPSRPNGQGKMGGKPVAKPRPQGNSKTRPNVPYCWNGEHNIQRPPFGPTYPLAGGVHIHDGYEYVWCAGKSAWLVINESCSVPCIDTTNNQSYCWDGAHTSPPPPFMTPGNYDGEIVSHMDGFDYLWCMGSSAWVVQNDPTCNAACTTGAAVTPVNTNIPTSAIKPTDTDPLKFNMREIDLKEKVIGYVDGDINKPICSCNGVNWTNCGAGCACCDSSSPSDYPGATKVVKHRPQAKTKKINMAEIKNHIRSLLKDKKSDCGCGK
tara:strand:- start:8746 stop:9675 length:930 start_codon:yes stop_codon:yes gene_type:complete